MTAHSVERATLAGDPFAAAALAVAIAEEERRTGRPLTPGERDGFARGFFAPSYRAEVRHLMALGVDEPEEDEE